MVGGCSGGRSPDPPATVPAAPLPTPGLEITPDKAPETTAAAAAAAAVEWSVEGLAGTSRRGAASIEVAAGKSEGAEVEL
jgi:hypothetical protein